MTDDDKALVERLRAFYQDICGENHEAADRIEALSAEVERLNINGIHTCHDECQRVPCRQRREIERLRSILEQWLETAREHLDTEVAGRTFEALERTK